jgi:hypothetical protein
MNRILTIIYGAVSYPMLLAAILDANRAGWRRQAGV